METDPDQQLAGSLSIKRPSILIATWFGSGLSPKAPGTMGSLAALPFAWGLMMIGGENALLIAALVCFVIGNWATDIYMQASGTEDPSPVVVDEVAGQWISLLPIAAAPTLGGFLLGFVLFRAFDIWKPFPISWLDQNMKGSFGVMIDDVVAGVAAAGCLGGLLYFFPTIFG